MVRHMMGITDEERQKRREEILGTKEADFHQFADALETVCKNGMVVVVASAGDVAVANEKRPGFLRVKNVL